MKRREFLKSLGLMTAAMSMPAILVGQDGQDDPNIKTISFDADTNLDAGLDRSVTAIIIGAGNRGGKYSDYAARFPGSFNIVGVSDIREVRKNAMGDRFAIPAQHRFGDWSEVFTVPRFADTVIISTPDDLHYAPCMKALEMGYNVLLEKPIAQSEKECTDILRQARKYGGLVAVCHVLRYAPYFEAMRQVIRSGDIGDVVSIQHLEPIGADHMAHSYVRGNWHNSKKTNPIIIAKSCHDLDIMRWMIDKPFEEVSAFGGLSLFTKENAPAGAAARCLDCPVERKCAFSAKRYYYEERKRLHVFDLTGDQSAQGEQILGYLRSTDYGRCVFDMDNDQCDHYVMNIRFGGGTTAAFSMEGLTSYEGRLTRVMGTKGDIVGDMYSFICTDFLTGDKTRWQSNISDGHAGGDMRLVRDFVKAVYRNDESLITSSIEASVESHIAGFRAEKSRLRGKVEKIPRYKA